MNSTLSYLIIGFLFITTLYLLVSSNTEYVCYDGSIQSSAGDCPRVPVANIDERIAERNVDNYGRAVAGAMGGSFNRVSIYREDGHFKSSVLFTSSIDREINEVLLQINGTTGSVTCLEGCSYLEPRSDEIEEELENSS